MDPLHCRVPASPTPNPEDQLHRHNQADELLAALAECGPGPRRRQLEHDIVVLTGDIADRAARRYRDRGVEIDDLRQVALFGLFKAIRRFRPGEGPSFAAYAVPTVTGELKRHFRDLAWAVRPPRRVQDLAATARRREEQVRAELHREPTSGEVARDLQVDRRELDAAMVAASSFHTSSLDHGPADRDPVQVADRHDAYAELDTRDALRRALRSVTDREREILRLRFVEDRTQSEIGEAVGVSQMHVSRLLSTTLAQLRRTLEAHAAA